MVSVSFKKGGDSKIIWEKSALKTGEESRKNRCRQSQKTGKKIKKKSKKYPKTQEENEKKPEKNSQETEKKIQKCEKYPKIQEENLKKNRKKTSQKTGKKIPPKKRKKFPKIQEKKNLKKPEKNSKRRGKHLSKTMRSFPHLPWNFFQVFPTFHLQHDGLGHVVALGLAPLLQALLPVRLRRNDDHNFPLEALEGRELPALPRVVHVALGGKIGNLGEKNGNLG